MSWSGRWCWPCGEKYGVTTPSKLRAGGEFCRCNGCGKRLMCWPAAKFTISVGSARAARHDRELALWEARLKGARA
jgi:hypothetical protein